MTDIDELNGEDALEIALGFLGVRGVFQYLGTRLYFHQYDVDEVLEDLEKTKAEFLSYIQRENTNARNQSETIKELRQKVSFLGARNELQEETIDRLEHHITLLRSDIDRLKKENES